MDINLYQSSMFHAIDPIGYSGLSIMPIAFKDRVLYIVRGIAPGRTKSYKEVATLAGNPKAARAVGKILNANKDPNVPCHRVIKSNGDLGGYNGLKGPSKSDILLNEIRETRQ